MADWVLWIKVVHILAFVSWMAGLFYLPRLFVYHADASPGGEASNLFKTMESRLLKAIMRPAAVATLASGGVLAWLSGFSILEPWLAFKLLAVVALIGFHGRLESHARSFGREERHHGSRYFRVINEIPTILLIAIVVFAIVKPWQ
jgi:protoporphyrinogen IX oxidase